MLRLLERPMPFSRGSLEPGHFTASAFVLSSDRRRVLLIHHKKLGRWLQPGGHVEASDEDLWGAARREVSEETGVTSLRSPQEGIFDLDIHEIPDTPREPAHRHFDVRYLFVADNEQLVASPEVDAARWVPLGGVRELNSDASVVRCTDILGRLPQL
jgi:8-oxo-dGTP pyrophosphatase MutT (NUDIX family)